MSRSKYLAVGGCSGTVGFLTGRLTGADVKSLLAQLLTSIFQFLHEQGAYASFAIVMSVGFGWLAVWCIQTLVNGKQGEIDRVVGERDKLQQIVIEHWQSSLPEKGKKR